MKTERILSSFQEKATTGPQDPSNPTTGLDRPTGLRQIFSQEHFCSPAKLAHIPTDLQISSQGCFAHARG